MSILMSLSNQLASMAVAPFTVCDVTFSLFSGVGVVVLVLGIGALQQVAPHLPSSGAGVSVLVLGVFCLIDLLRIQ